MLTNSLIRPSHLLATTSLACLMLAAPASAQDATWLASPGSATYGTAANWSTGAVPTGTAFFGASSTTALTVGAITSVGGLTLNADAAAYSIATNNTFNITGAGIAINGGSLTLTNNFYTYFKNASSAGSATINNPSGYLFFQNTSTAANATINNNIYTLFQNSSSAGNATINNTGGNAGVFFSGTSTAANATIVSDHLLSFEDSATAGNASIVNNGQIALIGTSTTGSATIVNNGTMTFQGHSSGGTAQITNGATASIDFSSSTGVAGDNPNTIGSLAGGGKVYLASNQVTIGGNNLSTAFTGVISDCGTVGSPCYATYFGGSTGGSLVKAGTGTLTLGGINTYTGATTILGGTLSVDGSIATSSLTTVNASGTLGGNGTVGSTLINGGTLAPGNSIGALGIAGNLAFSAASRYMVDVSPSSADRVNVTGTASLGGAAVNASFTSGSYVSKQYTILNATGGVTGTFGALTSSNLPANITSALSYDANNAYLNLTLRFVPTTPTDSTTGSTPSPAFGNGLSGNQNGVGNTLVNYFNRTGGIPMAFGGLTATGLTQASGETTAGTQQPGFTAATQFVGTLSDPTTAGRGADAPGAMGYAEEGDALNAYASTGRKRSGTERDTYAMITKAPPRGFEARWSVWASGFGGTLTTHGNTASGTNNSSSRIGGVAVGADYWLSPQTVVGFALAGGATSFSVAGGGGGQSDLFQVGGFVRHGVGSAYVTATAAYGWQQVTTDRNVGTDGLRARFDTNSYSARLEGGNRFVTSWLGVALTPYAAAQLTYLDLPSYAETSAAGSGTFALAYAGKGIAATRSELGLRSDKSFAVSDALLTLRGRAAWAHDYNTERSASATFQSLPGASFVVNGARPASDAALTTAEAELRFVNGISVGATFEGEFSDVTRSYAGKGVVRYGW